MKFPRHHAVLSLVMLGALVCACNGGACCAAITRLDISPRWICAGEDTQARIHFTIETYDADQNYCECDHVTWHVDEQVGTTVNRVADSGSLTLVGTKVRWSTAPDGILARAVGRPTGRTFSLEAICREPQLAGFSRRQRLRAEYSLRRGKQTNREQHV